MGQRLNIEIIQNGNTLANAYYHWSAYTSSSLSLTKEILDQVEHIQHDNPVVKAIRLLEVTGALLTSEEIEKMKQKNTEEKFNIALSRNDGLIAISKDGIETTREWEEGRVEFNLDTNTVNFQVFCEYDKDEYLNDYGESEEEYQRIPIKAFNFENIPFADFNQLAQKIIELIEDETYNIRLENGDVISFIE